MPVPAEIEPVDEPLVAAYRSAWGKVTAEFDRVAADPLKFARSRRLQEILRSISHVMLDVDSEAEDWIATSLPSAYLNGMLSEGGGVGEMVWTQIHQNAVQQVAQDLFNDLLSATKGVNDSAKGLVRAIARDESLQKLIEGRTAKQAGAEMQKVLEKQGLYSVIYKDGSRHGLAEYSQVAIRSKTAVAYNTGTLNQHSDIKFFEVFDGPGCGWVEHGDPTQALGLIVTRAEAMATPISHPNCRRSFGPRPDVLSKEHAKDLGENPLTVQQGETTIGQLEDQKAADAARMRAQGRKTSKTSKTAKEGPTKALGEAEPLGLPSQAAPDALDSVIDASKFEPAKKAFGPGVKNRGYARMEQVPGVTDLIDAGWSPGEAVAEHERLYRNARNVERRAKKKLGTTDTSKVIDTGPKLAEIPKAGKFDDLLDDEHLLQGDVLFTPQHSFIEQQAWYDRIAIRGPNSPVIPVKDLNIDGYVVKNGAAIRANGRSYLIEVATEDDVFLQSAEFTKLIQTTEGALEKVPENLKVLQRGMAKLKGNNPADAYWAEKYNKPGFKSAATGGNGATHFWNTEPRPGTILHEFGHNVDSHLGSPGKWLSASDEWTNAVTLDEKSSAFHGASGFQGSIAGHTITPGKIGVTDYGQVQVKEDFAESVRLYMADRHNGFLGYTNVDGTKLSVRFADVYPERAAVLDHIFGFEPVHSTTFQLHQIEKATKQYVERVISNVEIGGNDYLNLTEVALPIWQKKYGLSKETLDEIFHDLGPKAYKADLEAKAAAKAAAELEAAKAAEASAKAAAQAAALKEIKYEKLSLGDKTSIGLKKKNAINKALNQGKSDSEAKAIGEQVYAKELQIKLDNLARSKGLEPVSIQPAKTAVLTGEVRPEFQDARRLQASRFLGKAGKERHPGAASQYDTASQAKANIAAELAERLRTTEARADFERFMGRSVPIDSGMYQQATSNLIQRWAGSSGDSHAKSLVLQKAIKEEFGLKGEVYVRGVSEATKRETEALYLKEGPFVRRFVRAMYEHTQEELAKEGVEEVSLYRGVRSGVSGTGAQRVYMQPANSFSTSPATSRNFGSVRISGTIPANRVLGSARTGFGCLNEHEIVVFDSDGLFDVGYF